MKKLALRVGVLSSALFMSTLFLHIVDAEGNKYREYLAINKAQGSTIENYKAKSNLNLRKGASTKEKVILVIPKGKEMELVSKSGNWSKVKYGKQTGYVSNDFISLVKSTAIKESKEYVTTTSLNVRKGSSAKDTILETLKKGARVTSLTKEGNWVQVKTGKHTGWVSSTFLKEIKSNAVEKVTPKQDINLIRYEVIENLNLRKGEDTKSAVVVVIPKGEPVEYLGKASSGWYNVSYNGKTGFVNPKYLKELTSHVVKESTYNLTVQDMVTKQVKVRAQTDLYKNQSAWVERNKVSKNGKEGKVKEKAFVRESEKSDSHIFGTLDKNKTVKILKETKTHYEISYQTWRNAKEKDVLNKIDPNQIDRSTSDFFQFLDLSQPTKISSKELDKVLTGKGVLEKQGNAFSKAGEKHGVNEMYLISHAILETGHGKSQLAKGIKVSQVDGKKVPEKTVYNMFGIGAFDSNAVKAGSERAYKEGWFTPDESIIGGAKFISESYINHPTHNQNTLYKMRWNPEKPGQHQYATDIGWASKQVKSIYELYQLVDNYNVTFDVPVYR